MADPRVTILKRDGDQSAEFSNYEDARNSSVAGDLIMIRADLDEQIKLKDKVDIWIYPGVVLKFNPTTNGATITDNDVPVECNIYGDGIIMNLNSSNSGCECIKISHSGTKLSMRCNHLDTTIGVSAAVKINNATKFELICNSILSKGHAMFLGENVMNIIPEVYINVNKIETGDISTTSPISGTSIIIYANGFLNINEIVCKNRGHCLLHRAGSITAIIKKLTTMRVNSETVSTILVGQGNGLQNLILYFDEINCIGSLAAIEHKEGNCFFKGRRIFSSTSYAFVCGGNLTKGGTLNCCEIISESYIAISISNFDSEYIIDAEYIEGNYTGIGFPVVIISEGSTLLIPKYTIKNAKIKNKNASTEAKGIFFQNIYPRVTLNNVKIVTGEDDNNIIYLSIGTSINVYNYGLFGNYALDESKIKLKIGTGLADVDYNYQYIVDPLLT